MLYSLVGSIDLVLSGPPATRDRVARLLSSGAPRPAARSGSLVRLVALSGSPRPGGRVVLRFTAAAVTRDDRGHLVVTAPGVSASIHDEVELRFSPHASSHALRAVLDAVWPLALPHHGRFHVHGAVVRDVRGRGWLLAGDSNIGKSTSTMALVAAGWQYTADDAAYLVHEWSAEVIAHGWPEPICLTARSAGALGVSRRPPLGVTKSAVVLEPALAARRVDSIRLHYLLFPELGTATDVRLLRPSEALARLVPASAWIIAQPEIARAYWSLLVAVASLPAAALVLGPELLEQPGRLAAHLLNAELTARQ